MKNIMKLTAGELKRLVKYMILPVSFVTVFIWVIIFLLVSKEEAQGLAPLFIFTDISLMTVVLVAASHHLEKQEGTMKSMMMLPISVGEILTSKIIAAMVLGLESTVVTSLALYFIHGIMLDYVLLLLFIIVIGIAHAAIGFFLSLFSHDFTGTLGLLFIYMFVFVIPSVLYTFGLIGADFEWLLMLSPSHASSHLITAVFTGSFDAVKTAAGLAYLLILSFVLLVFAVYPRFKTGAVRG